jgi:cell fate (sporulation/competence/biofilm development) regulator YlbF (YheA/YmcA/DUF963 family)
MENSAKNGAKKADRKRTMEDHFESIDYDYRQKEKRGSRENMFRTVTRGSAEGPGEWKQFNERKKLGMNIALDFLNASAGTWVNGTLTRAKIGDIWYEVVLDQKGGLKELLRSSDQTGTVLGKKLSIEEKSKRTAAINAFENHATALKDKMGEGTEATVNATNVSTKNIVSSTNNISNVKNGGGGGSQNRSFGSGYGYASDVERCNIS